MVSWVLARCLPHIMCSINVWWITTGWMNEGGAIFKLSNLLSVTQLVRGCGDVKRLTSKLRLPYSGCVSHVTAHLSHLLSCGYRTCHSSHWRCPWQTIDSFKLLSPALYVGSYFTCIWYCCLFSPWNSLFSLSLCLDWLPIYFSPYFPDHMKSLMILHQGGHIIYHLSQDNFESEEALLIIPLTWFCFSLTKM